MTEEAIDAGIAGLDRPPGCRPGARRCAEPGRQTVEGRLEGLDSFALGGGGAQHLDQGRRSRLGQPGVLEGFHDQPHVADADRGIGDAGLRQRPVGKRDHFGVGGGPGGAQELGADLGELAQLARLGVGLVTENGPRAAHAAGEGGTFGRFGKGPHDAGRELGPQADARGARSGELEQLGHDARAALALVKLGEFEDRRSDGQIACAGEAVEQLPFERRQPGVVGGQPVARAPHQPDRPLGDGNRDSPGAHEAAPSDLMISSALETESSSTDKARPLSSCRVANRRRLNTCLRGFVGTDDHRQLMAARRAVTHLLADRDRVGKYLGTDARCAQSGRDGRGHGGIGPRKIRHQHRGGARR